MMSCSLRRSLYYINNFIYLLFCNFVALATITKMINQKAFIIIICINWCVHKALLSVGVVKWKVISLSYRKVFVLLQLVK